MWAMIIVSDRISAFPPDRSSIPISRTLIGPSMFFPAISDGMNFSWSMFAVAHPASAFGTITTDPDTTAITAPRMMHSFAHNGSRGFDFSGGGGGIDRGGGTGRDGGGGGGGGP